MQRKHFLVVAALAGVTLLAGCESMGKKPVGLPPVVNIAACQRVESPPAEPLQDWSFVALPGLAPSASAGALVAGVTAEGLRAILSNHATFKRREDKWQNRAEVTNKCLDAVNAPTPVVETPTVTAEKPKRKRFGLF